MDEPTEEQLKILKEDIMSGRVMIVEVEHYKKLTDNLDKSYDANKQQAERIKDLEAALKAIWPFIEEDFPKGTGDNHGTCASDLYLLAARELEQALKGGE